MSQKIVGFIESVNGKVVKKNILLGQEQELKKGDLLSLDDAIWVRSLDGKTTIKLHSAELSLSAGMRVNLNENFLKQNNTFEFFSKEEISDILQTDVDFFDMSLDRNFTTNDIFFADDVSLEDEKGSETYDNLQIDYKFVSYKDKLVFKIICDKDIIVKAYLVGNSSYILEKPMELNSKALKKENTTYLMIANKFTKPSLYLMYLNILNNQNKTLYKEVFCEIDVKINY